MLPVGGKPVVQHVVEELADAGIERVVFVTGRGKESIQDHFDHDPVHAHARAARRRRADRPARLRAHGRDVRLHAPAGPARARRRRALRRGVHRRRPVRRRARRRDHRHPRAQRNRQAAGRGAGGTRRRLRDRRPRGPARASPGGRDGQLEARRRLAFRDVENLTGSLGTCPRRTLRPRPQIVVGARHRPALSRRSSSPTHGSASGVACSTLRRIARRLHDGTYKAPPGSAVSAPGYGPAFPLRDGGRVWSCRLQNRGLSGPSYAVRCTRGASSLSWRTGETARKPIAGSRCGLDLVDSGAATRVYLTPISRRSGISCAAARQVVRGAFGRLGQSRVFCDGTDRYAGWVIRHVGPTTSLHARFTKGKRRFEVQSQGSC